MNSTQTLKEAIEAFGRPEFTRRVGETKQNIWNWIQRGCVPEEKAPDIERSTGIPVEVLCGSAPWSRIDDSQWPHPCGRPVIDHAKRLPTPNPPPIHPQPAHTEAGE